MNKSLINVLRGTSCLDQYDLTASSYAYLNGFSKRVVDIFGAIIGLVTGTPTLLCAILVIKVVDRIPVIFSQKRLGYLGREFTIYKLRTLKLIDDRKLAKLENIQHKPNYETTTTGKFWRVTSIDEIIQFWLVLKGDMSLIGHRPIPIYYLHYLDQIEGMDKIKLDHYLNIIRKYKPGMSSLSSVNGRGDLTMQQKMEYDLIYAQNASFVLDLSLLIRTMIVVITRKGAK